MPTSGRRTRTTSRGIRAAALTTRRAAVNSYASVLESISDERITGGGVAFHRLNSSRLSTCSRWLLLLAGVRRARIIELGRQGVGVQSAAVRAGCACARPPFVRALTRRSRDFDGGSVQSRSRAAGDADTCCDAASTPACRPTVGLRAYNGGAGDLRGPGTAVRLSASLQWPRATCLLADPNT